MAVHGVPDRRVPSSVQVVLASALVASHATTTSPYVYPHYVLLILFHPWLLSRGFGIHVPAWQVAWISATLFVHPIGGLYGLYATVWWFDHLTHFASATLVASIGYTIIRAQQVRRGGPDVSHGFIVAFTLAFVMAAGFLWELIETFTPLLTVYGPNDTVLDVVFDFLGGVVVVVFGRRFLDGNATMLAAHADEHWFGPR